MELNVFIFGPDSLHKEPPYPAKPFTLGPYFGKSFDFTKCLPKDAKEGLVTVELDDQYLFSDQFNTKEGYRLFDYTKYPTIEMGHYLDLYSKMKLDELRSNRYVCGYCGRQYKTPEAEAKNYWCYDCYDSRFLTEDNLWMTELFPIIKDGKDSMTLRGIHTNFGIPDRVLDEYKRKQRESLIKRKRKFLDRQHEAIKEIEQKTKIMANIYDRGLDPEYLDAVYYTHSNKVMFNAFGKSLSDMDIEKIKYKMIGFNKCKWSIR